MQWFAIHELHREVRRIQSILGQLQSLPCKSRSFQSGRDVTGYNAEVLLVKCEPPYVEAAQTIDVLRTRGAHVVALIRE